MTPRFAALLTAAALLAAPARAQPRAVLGGTPNPVGGKTPTFQTGPADWVCHDGRCTYALAPGAAGQGWTACTASWFPTHGGWRKQNICH